jgi:hypothetical protein
MSRNCSGFCRRDFALTTAFSICPLASGSAPSWPAERSTFCDEIALVLSAVLLPMAFFGGSTGVIYRQFSVTIVSAMALRC